MGTTSSGFEALQEPFDAIDFQKVVNTWLAPMHLQCSNPLQVGWYNKARSETADGTQTIDAPDDAVAFAIYSVPRYLEVVLEHYAREKPAKDLVDGATNSILDALRLRIPSALDAQVINTDKGPPYFHVQTIGAVCAEDQHVEAEDVTGDGSDEWREDLSDRLEEVRDPKMWGTESEMRRKIFAVNVHPVWGGWYAYRALVVLRNGRQALEQQKPLDFLSNEEKKKSLSEYNLRHQLCLWRDLSETHPPDRRYSPDEFFFFTETSPEKRRRFLDMKVSYMTAIPAPRWS
ncbi:unnamed protein product [Durusdinium trenchii]|uniref:Uncharacterized protein n=2 Tax=Durusdinium trenchii TaxID=1381693 RepID=A0ABP0S3L8_9DINO